MEEALYQLLTAVITAILSAFIAFIRTKYAKFGDGEFVQFKKLVDWAKTTSVIYPSIADLSAKLEKDYDNLYKIWVTGEIKGWEQLYSAAGDFYDTYNAILALVTKFAPSK